MSNVDGLISGLDTSGIINQLMQIERQGQTRLQTRKTTIEKSVAAYQDLNTKFAALRDAARAIATPANWALTKATSSAEGTVVATASGTAPTGTFSFSVETLAAAASRISSGAVASTTSVVAAGPIEITKGGVTTSIDVGDGTLTSVVAAVNSSNSGVRAAAVQVAPGSYKLQLTSTTTGSASAFTVGGAALTGLGSLDALVAAADATLLVGGASPAAYTVTSPTNTITDVVPGVTLGLKKADPGVSVTVDIAADVQGLADRVSKLVDAANAALTQARTASATGTNGAAGGPLAGDATVRRLEQEIMRAVSGLLRADGSGNAGFAGIQTTRQGAVTFDRAKFVAAYTADPTAVAKVFEARGTGSVSGLMFVSAEARTVAGTYGVSVTTAASRAAVTGSVVGGPLAGNETITITSGGKSATYNATAGSSLADVAAGLTAAFGTNGLSLVAAEEGGALVVRSVAYGTAAEFAVTSAGSGAGQTGLALGTYKGTDVAGSFTLGDGTVVAATGKGRLLQAGLDVSPLFGLAVQVTGAPAGGTVTYEPGLARRIESVAASAIDTAVGSLKLAIEGRKKEIDALDDGIASWDTRLALREAALRKQFNAMEVALGRLRDQSSWLSSQISTLNVNNNRT